MSPGSMSAPIKLRHNLKPDRFVWLWAKYVNGVNDRYHCTNCIRGPYSKRLSKHNPELSEQRVIALNELGADKFKALYICGVSNNGYSKKENYPHNLHAAILPMPGKSGLFRFEDWQISVENGVFMRIPKLEELPLRYRALAPEYTTCRIFRWAVCFGGSDV